MKSCTALEAAVDQVAQNADQPGLSSLAPSQMPKLSRNPSELTAEATSSETLLTSPRPATLHDDAIEVEVIAPRRNRQVDDLSGCEIPVSQRRIGTSKLRSTK